MPPTTPIFETKDLCFSRGTRPILQEANIRFEKGGISGILGTSGIGKTTLLKLLTGQITPDSGEVFFNGESLTNMSKKALREARLQMGVLFQNGALFTDYDVFENIAFPLRARNCFTEKEICEKALTALEQVGLRGAAKLLPSELSGGMARRVAFARTVVTAPAVVLFDEPFTGQDPIAKGALLELVAHVKKNGMSGIIVSHDIEDVFKLADYCYILGDARVVAEGKSEVVKASKDPFVRQFLSGAPDGPVPFQYPVTNTLQAAIDACASGS